MMLSKDLVADTIMKVRIWLDYSTIFPKSRWAAVLVSMLFIIQRVIRHQAWYVTLYALGVFELNLFIAFLSPAVDPITESYILPRSTNAEFKPFERKLPEFTFWFQSATATLISLFTVMFNIFDIPVYWPVLLVYFVFITIVMLKQQIVDMIEHKYIPFNFTKKRYGDVAT